jgi:hypothetical protein
MKHPISLNAHPLEYVGSLVPKISLSILAFYKSTLDPNTYFLMKAQDQRRNDDGHDVMCFTFFEVSRSRMQRLLSSNITINNFEDNARAVYQVEFIANDDGDSLEDVFAQEVPGNVDMAWRILSAEEVQAKGRSIYAVENSGTLKLLNESLGAFGG